MWLMLGRLGIKLGRLGRLGLRLGIYRISLMSRRGRNDFTKEP